VYAYIKGKLAYKHNEYIIVEAGGIGYKIFTPLTTIQASGNPGDEARIYTHLYVREDVLNLYGFMTQEELGMFELLISVSGVGPKAALSLISSVSPSKFGLAVITEDVKTLTAAQARNIPIPVSKKDNYSMDRNIWHLSHEGSDLEDPWNEPEYEKLLKLMVSPEKAPDKPAYVEIYFEEGIPKMVNGKEYSPVKLLEVLNKLGGENGIGIIDMVENRLVGMKSRGIYETPGGTIMYAAHRELELLCLDRDTLHYKDIIAQRFAELVYFGQWYTPLREALSAFVDSTQKTVTGTVRMKLYKGNCMPAGAKSPYSLYSEELSTFGRDEIYNQKDAEGFINLFGLPIKVKAMLHNKKTGDKS
jgi:argininosuccinate synthase